MVVGIEHAPALEPDFERDVVRLEIFRMGVDMFYCPLDSDLKRMVGLRLIEGDSFGIVSFVAVHVRMRSGAWGVVRENR